WNQLLERGAPTALARDVVFWHGEALGRMKEPGRAEADLKRFVDGGAHPLAATAQLRLGWWALAAGHAPEALAAFRAYAPPAGSARLGADRQGRDRPRAGQPRRGAYAVRPGAHGRRRHADGRSGDVPAGSRQLRAAGIRPGAGRPRLAGQR